MNRATLPSLTVFSILAICLAQGGPNQTAQVFILRPSLEPSNFVTAVTNPYYPLQPGTRYFYEAQTEDGTEHTEVFITTETKKVMGVTTTVVRIR